MGRTHWSQWLFRNLISRPKRGRKADRKGRFRRLEVEALEGRILPSTVTWTNASGGDWDTASNWSSRQVPGTGDDVVINTSGITVTHSSYLTDSVNSLTSQANLSLSLGTLSIASTSTIHGNFTLSGGTLSGAGTLTVSGALTWTDGWMSGAGATVVAAGGTLQIGGATGNHFQTLDGRTFSNGGTGTWIGANGLASFGQENGSVFNNLSGATLTASSSLSWNDSTGNSTFNNAGTFTKSGDAGNTIIGPAFNNSGSVQVQSGTLSLTSGGNETGGFSVASGSTLGFDGTSAFTLTGSSSVAGAGGVEVGGIASLTFDSGVTWTAASVNVDGGTLTAATGAAVNLADLSFSAGIIDGSGPFTLTGQSTWSGGEMTGSGMTAVAAGASLQLGWPTGNAGETLDKRTLSNAGAVTFVGGAFLTGFDQRNGSAFDNLVGATLTIGTSFNWGNDEDNSTLNNEGTIIKSGDTGSTNLAVTLNNSNIVEVDAGTLALGGGTFSGGATFHVATGATVNLDSAAEVHYSGTLTGSGGGTVLFSGGVLLVAPGGLTLDFAGGMFQWAGGLLSAQSGDVTNQGTINLTGSGQADFGYGTLDNLGTLIQTGSGDFGLSTSFNFPAVLKIESGGQYLLESDSGVVTTQMASIENEGTIRKTMGTGVSKLSIQGALANGGVIEADSGTLDLEPASFVQFSGGTLSGGTWDALDGAALDFSTGTAITANDATITLGGAGATVRGIAGLISDGGSFTLTGGADFTTTGGFTNSGSLTVGAGSKLAVAGNFAQTAAGTLNVQLGGTPASGLYGQVNVAHTAALAGAFDLTLTNGFNPAVGQQFGVLSFASETGTFGRLDGLNPIFTTALGSTSLDLTAAANAVDLSLSNVSAPTAATAGQTVTVNWQATDQSNQAATGAWQDSVYLSATPTITAASTLLGTVQHSGLGAHVSYNGSLTTQLPALPPGNYYVLVQTDSLYQVPDPNRANNVLTAASGLLTVSLPVLTPGTPGGSTFTAADEDQYYQVTVPAGGALVVSLHSTASTGAVALYVSQGALPTAYSYQEAAALANQPNQTVVVPQVLSAGTYYILAHSISGAAATAAYTLTVTQSTGLSVSAISSYAGGNGGNVTVEIDGTNFSPNATAALTLGGATLNATAIDYVNPTQLYATFNLTGAAVGNYTLTVKQGGQSAPAPTTFQVAAANPAPLDIAFNPPQFVRAGRTGSIVLAYTNDSNEDVVAPDLTLSSTNANVSFSTPDDPNNYTQSAEVLAVASGGPAGILRPGQSGQLTITLLSDDTVPHDAIPLAVDQIQSGQSIDWASQESALQPGNIPTAAWNVLFSNLTATLGANTDSYNAALAQAATYLGGLGETTAQVSDVGLLYSFLVSQADAEFPTATLTSAVDASLATPGGPALAIDRTFVSSIAGRSTPGIFGLGWTTSWQTSLSVDGSGNVTINTGGASSFFVHQVNGGYLDTAGEYGALTLSAGAYTFTDVSGDQFVFLPSGLLSYEQDTNGNRITLGYNTQNQPVTLTYSNPSDPAEPAEQLTLTYLNGLVSQVADGTGNVTTYGYDAAGHLLSVTAPGNLKTFYGYDTGSNPETVNALLSITNPDGSQENFTYDSLGRLSGASNNGGADPVVYTYDGEGEITATDIAGDQTTVWYNDLGLAARVEDPRGAVTSYLYDANGNLVRATDAVGDTTQFAYDANGNLTQTVNPLGQTVKMTYDGLSDLTSITDAAGNTTQYQYNSAGNLLNIVYPGGNQQSFSYDPLGNLSETVERNGDPVGYQYNAQGLVTQETFADGTSTTFVYDAHGNLLTAKTFAAGGALTGTTTLKYNAANELTKITYPNGQYLQFTYDPITGQRTQSVDQDGFTVNYSYDALGRLSELKDGANNRIVQYTYNNLGQLHEKLNGNGTYTIYGYDAAGNLTSEINYLSGTTVNSSFTYTYNLLGEETSMTDAAGHVTSYAYDATGQLTAVALPGGGTIVYAYNAAGDRTEVVSNGTPTLYTSNADNEVTQVGSTVYTYDANGNLHTSTDAGGTTTYTYNDLNQLTSIAAPDGTTTTFQYSPLGYLVGTATTNGATSSQTNDLVDPSGLGNVVASYDGNGALIANYVYGLGLVSQNGPSGAGYYDFDGSGNTVGITGGSGAYVNQYSYLPFGETTTAKAALPNPFTFAGQLGVMQIGANLFNLRARDYTPATGQFISNDPLGLGGGDANIRRYVGNSPTNATDPSGLDDGLGDFLTGGNWSKWFKSQHDHTATMSTSTDKPAQVTFDATKGGAVQPQSQPGKVTYDYHNQTGPVQLQPKGTTYQNIPAYDPNNGSFLGTDVVPVPPGNQYVGPDPLMPGYYSETTPDGLKDYKPIRRDPPKKAQVLLPLLIASAENLTSQDPNALLGPAGYGAQGFIQPGGAWSYTAEFENDGSAAAQDVTVTAQLAPNLDWSTFQLGSFRFGSVEIAIPAGLTEYHTTVAYQNADGSALNVVVALDFNVQTGLLTATFTSLDPATGEAPSGVFDGFLPPDNASGVGEGSVQYTVRPNAGLPTGTAISQQASIVFDTNAAISTNTVVNTIDVGAPTSSVNTVPAKSPGAFTVSWSGQDDAGGSGVGSYDVYVSDNGGPFTPFLTGTTQTSAVFTGVNGHVYGFYSVAIDNVGNRQPTPTVAEATTTVVASTLVSDFAGQGVWSYTATAGWQQLTPADASLLAVNANGDVAAEFAGAGVWRYTEATQSWQQLTAANASVLGIDAAGDVAADLANSGVYLYSNAAGWRQLTPANASVLAMDAAGDLAAEFPGGGVYRYTTAARWKQLTPANASLLAMDSNGDLAAEFPGNGVYLYTTAAAWRQLTPANASALAMDPNGDLAAEFPGGGVYRYTTAANWQQLTPADASLLTMDATGDVAAEFPGAGLYQYGGAGWQLLTVNHTAVSLPGMDANGDLFVQLSGQGVWRFTAAAGWQQLKASNAALLAVDANGDVAAEFSGQGVWRYETATGWQQLTAADASQLGIDNNGDVFADLAGAGIYRYTNGSGWKQLATANATRLVVDAAGDVAADLVGAGLWRYTAATGFQQLSGNAASALAIDATGDVFADLVNSHGVGLGVYRYTTAAGWQQLAAANAAQLATDAAGDLFAEFQGYGVYRFTNSAGWKQAVTADAALLADDVNGDVFASFGGTGWDRYAAGSGFLPLAGTQGDASVLA